MADTRWRERAACRTADPELFFPAAEAGPALARQVADAKRVCGVCSVRAECLTWALDALPYGIAGGLTEDERRGLRRFGRHAAAGAARERAERVRARGA